MGRESKSHVVMSWVQIALIVLPLFATTAGTFRVMLQKLDTISEVLHEVKGRQKVISDDVIRLQGRLDGIAKETTELKAGAMTGKDLELVQQKIEALESRLLDLINDVSRREHKSEARIETLRTLHNFPGNTPGKDGDP